MATDPSWARFYRTGKIEDYVRYRETAREQREGAIRRKIEKRV